MTCRAIVNATIDYGIDKDEREKVLLEDIVGCINRKCFETARAIYTYLLDAFPEKQDLWLRAIESEKKYGDNDKLDKILHKSMEKCSKTDIFWLMAAKQKWKKGDVQSALATLQNGFIALPNNENIFLAKVKIHRQLGQYADAQDLLTQAREICNTPKVWMQSIQIERELNNDTEAWKLCEEALKRHSSFAKLWMIAGQLQEKIKNNEKARKIYEKGLEYNKNCIHLWICAIQLEELMKNYPKARSIWEKARIQNPNNPDLWYTAIKLEEYDNNPAGAKYMLSRGLQECPKSGELWALAIEMEPKQLRNSKSVEALKHCDNDPYVILAVAKLFWKDRKYEKTRKWLERAIQINADYGDAWIYFCKFENDHGSKEAVEELKVKCKEAEPRHGRLWISLSKKVENWRASIEDLINQGLVVIKNEFNVIE